MSRRDPRSVRIRGVCRGEGGAVVLSIDVDSLHGAAGPPLLVLLTADEARLTADLLRDAARRHGRGRPKAMPLPVDQDGAAGEGGADADGEAAALEAGVLAVERWGRAIGRHARSLFGLGSPGGGAEPRAPP